MTDEREWSLYVMATTDQGALRFVKVGISSDVGNRLGEVQTGCPLRISYLWVLRVGDEKTARTAEKYLHQSLAKFHTWGEWFALDMEDESHKKAFDDACRESLFSADVANRTWDRHDWNGLRELARESIRRRAAQKEAGRAATRRRYVNTKVLDF